MDRRGLNAFIVVALIIVLGGAIYQSNQRFGRQGGNEQETIKIGVTGPLTGVLARFGEWTSRGAQIAAAQINASGGIDGRQIELVLEDDQCLGSRAVSVINKMQEVQDINTIVSFCTITSSAIAPVTKDKSIVFAPTFKLDKLAEADFPHYIAMQPTMLFEVTELFKYVQSQGFKSIGIIYTTNDLWISYKDAVVKLAAENGVEITLMERADFQANDFRTQLTKIKESDPDVLFGGLNPGPLGYMMKQKSELQFDVPVIGVWGTQAPDLITTSGNSADGIVYTYYYEDGFTEKNKEYAKAYTAKYAEEPELISASTYDILFIIKRVIEDCGSENVACMIEKTEKIKDYQGASGTFSFSNGTTIKDVFLKTIVGGEFVRLPSN